MPAACAARSDGRSRRSREQDWHTIFDVNVTGAFYFAQAVTPGMKRQRRGRIVNISSRAGLGVSLTGIQAYATAKAAQIGLTRQLAHELGPWGITVNNVAPGFVRSNPTTERQWESMGEAGQRALVEQHRAEAPGHAGRHRACRDVLRLGLCGLDHRPGAAVDGGKMSAMRGAISKRRRAEFWTS